MKNIPEQIVKLIFEKEYRELTADENNRLQLWLDESAGNKNAAKELSGLLRAYVKVNHYEHIDAEKAWKSVKARTLLRPKSRKNVLFRPATMAAAIIVPLFIIASLLYFMDSSRQFDNIKAGSPKAILELASGDKLMINSENQGAVLDAKGTEIGMNSENTLVCYPPSSGVKEDNTLIVPIGGEYRLVLSDGTKIAVNSGSKIRYPNVFNGSERVVELEGEAYFEVAKDADRPFIVKTRYSDVVVTGTKFNVCSYRDDNFQHITLEEGSVNIKRGEELSALTPGKQYFLDKITKKAQVTDVDTYLYTSWKEGVSRFQNMELDQLTAKMHRWYNIKFKFSNAEAKRLRFTGAFDRSSNLGEFVKIIESTTDVRFDWNDGEVLVSKK
jgi:ferric-dicitrate binding protein FerR (iron transport regulator)